MATTTPAPAQRIAPADTLRFASFDIKVLDPHFGGGGTTEFFQMMVYDALFAFDETMTPRPQMVGEYAWDDARTTLTMTLRPGLVFHDGAPVRAADAVASLRRWSEGPFGREVKGLTKSFDVVDEDTLTWTLNEPFGMALEQLTRIRQPPAIMPERIAETPVDEQITEIIGSGPFVFLPDEYVPGKQLHFARFDGYVPRDEPPSFLAGGKKVFVEKLEWKVMTDPATMVAALKAGEVDLVQEAPPAFRDELVADPDITLEPLRTGRQGLIYINHLAPPFDNVKARQALLWAINQEEHLIAMVGDPAVYEVCPSYFACGGVYATDVGSEALATQDLARATALMEEAGYDGETIVILTHPIADADKNGLVLASTLRKIGLNVDLQQMNYAAAISRRDNKDNPVESPSVGWHLFTNAQQEVSAALPALSATINGGCEEGGRFGWVCDPRIEELKAAIGQAITDEDRKRLSVELHRVMFETVPYIQIGLFSNEAAYRSNITGAVRATVPVYWSIRKQ